MNHDLFNDDLLQDDLFAEPQEAPSFGKYPCQPHPSGQGYIIDLPDGELIYVPKFIDKKVADRTMQVLLSNPQYDPATTDWHTVENVDDILFDTIQWKQDHMTMFGNRNALPRLTAWYGDEGKNYTYSGIQSYPNTWNTPLLWLKQQLEDFSQARFNSVLLNWYRDGKDHLSWHDDAEKELGKNPVIGSLNFGESRRFLLRRKSDHQDKIEILLGHGDLLIMGGSLQEYWQHSVPKQAKVKSSRINLTFRFIHSVA